MTFWTTYTPQKVCWELTNSLSKGKAADGRWMNHQPLILKSLQQLHETGIQGIRLVIFPEEVTENGKTYNWKAIETFLNMCKQNALQVDLCIGPYQYPNYPGIFLPKGLLQYVFNDANSLDTRIKLQEYGKLFLEKQIEQYGKDERIRGFHFANEWPDKQRIQGKEDIKTFISMDFMLWAAKYLKKSTDKLISLNTNIDATDKRKLKHTFHEIIGLLEDQARLGFDIYPSQETWRKAFFQKIMRLLEPYHRSYQWSCSNFPLCEMYFCEVEAQPWGSGQSWFRMISDEPAKEEKVLNYFKTSLFTTFDTYIKKTKTYEVSLWGADFWLSAESMGLHWPLEQVKKLTQQYRS